ncbi:MAG: spore coat protein [Flavonifractor plautii]
MNDQERITDLILTEKKMSANYDTFASGTCRVQLRDEPQAAQPGPPDPDKALPDRAAEGAVSVEQAPAGSGTAYTRFSNQRFSKANPRVSRLPAWLFKVETG